DLGPAFLRGTREGASAALARVSLGSHEFNRLGLTREMSVGAVAAVGVFLWLDSADLRKPAALAQAPGSRSPRPVVPLLAEGGRWLQQGLGSVIGLAEKPTDCEDIDREIAAHRGEDGPAGRLAAIVSGPPKSGYKWPDGSFRHDPPPDVQLAEVRNA